MGKKITVQATGGDPITFENLGTVADAKREMNLPTYTATVNGNPAQDSTVLPDYAFISLTEPMKGGV